MNASRTVYVRALFEPIKKLRVNLTSNWSRSRNSSEYIVYDGADFQSLNKMYSGNFSMSAIGLKSAFYSVGNNPEASAAVYNEFLEERKRVAAQLAKQRYGAGYNKGDIPMSECTHDCSSCGESCAERATPQSLRKAPHPESHIGKVFGVVSGKGGVGKSMVTSQLAVTLHRRGYKVGVMDADITGPSIPQAFGVHDKAVGTQTALYPCVSHSGIEVMSINLLLEDETDPVIWRGPVIGGVVQQFWTDVAWDVDYLFVDMPPGTGDVPLSVFQSIALDGIIVVTSPQELVSMVVEKAVKMAEKMDVPIVGVVENMSYVACPDCGKKIYLFGEGKSEEAAKRHGLPLLAQMPIDPKLAALVDAGKIEEFEGTWLNAAADALEKTRKRAE